MTDIVDVDFLVPASGGRDDVEALRRRKPIFRHRKNQISSSRCRRIAGLASPVWGFLLLFWPFAGAVVLAWWLGAYALVFGVTLLILVFRLRRQLVRPLSGDAVLHV